jgi:site-specific recombinase XerC
MTRMNATPRELRDDAMLAMSIGCGLRGGELLALTLESCHLAGCNLDQIQFRMWKHPIMF